MDEHVVRLDVEVCLVLNFFEKAEVPGAGCLSFRREKSLAENRPVKISEINV